MFCSKCGNQLVDNARFCTKCGAPVAAGTQGARQTNIQPVAMRQEYAQNAAAQPGRPAVDPETVLYQGVCLKRENTIRTLPGDAVINYNGLFYYKRQAFMNMTGKREPDFFVPSSEVMDITTSVKDMNKVMELHMRDGSVLEFYSPKFKKMLEAMETAVRGY